MKTEQEIRDHLLAKKLPVPVYKTLMWALGESVDEDFAKQVAHKQKRAKARAKGAGFENAVAKQLSLWWTDGEEDKYIRRVPLSGGYDKTSASGDVFCPSNPIEFPFSVECKNQEGWNMFQLLEGKGTPMGWWQQCVRDEEQGRYQREPVLIFTANQRPAFWLSRLSTMLKLEGLTGSDTVKYDYIIIRTESFQEVGGPVILLHFNDVLDQIPAKIAKQLSVEKR